MSYEKKVEVVKKVQDQQRSRLAGDLSKKIIGAMDKSFLGPQTVAWLNNMNEDLQIAGGQLTDGSLTSVAILDKLLDEFQRYAFQYNRNEPNLDYIISCRRPEPVGQEAANKTFMGFAYNSRWCMLLKAEPKTVTLSFVAPRLFYDHEDFRNVNEVLRFDGEEVQERMRWKVGELTVAYSQLSTIAKKAFARFIRVTRGECSDLEPLPIDFVEQTPPQAFSDEPEDDPQPSRIDIITDLIMTLIETVDAEMSEVDKLGITAIRNGQTDLKEILLERSKGLREFRQTAAESAKRWAGFLTGMMKNQS